MGKFNPFGYFSLRQFPAIRGFLLLAWPGKKPLKVCGVARVA